MRCAAGSPGRRSVIDRRRVDPSPQDPAAARRPCVRICRDRSRGLPRRLPPKARRRCRRLRTGWKASPPERGRAAYRSVSL